MAVIVFVVLVSAIAGLSFLLPRKEDLAEQVRREVVPSLSNALGREIRVGEVQVGFLPRIHVSFSNVAIIEPGEELPLLRASRVNVSIKIWPLLLSGGQNIQVIAIKLWDVNATLERRKDGSWNLDRVGSPASSGTNTGESREISVGKVVVVNGAVRVVDQAVEGREQRSVELKHLHLVANGISPGHRLSAHFTGALAAERQNVKGSISIDPLPAPTSKEKKPPQLEGNLTVNNLPVEAARNWMPDSLRRRFERGEGNVSVEWHTTANGNLAFKGETSAERLRLHGSDSDATLHAQIQTEVTPHPLQARTWKINRFEFASSETRLSGSASYDATDGQARFVLRAPQLNVGTFSEAIPGRRGDTEPRLPREWLRPIRAEGEVTLDHLHAGTLRTEEVRARLVIKDGVIHVTDGHAALYGGSGVFDHSNVDLVENPAKWDVDIRIDGLQLAQIAGERPGANETKGLISGHASATGRGDGWNQVSKDFTGSGAITIADAQLETAKLSEQIVRPLVSALHDLHITSSPPDTSKKGVPQKGLAGTFTLKDGWATITHPVTIATDFGSMSLEGRIGLDQRLDMKGDAVISPGLLAGLIDKKAILPKVGIHVPMKLGGTLGSPSVEDVDWAGIAKHLVLGEGLLKKAVEFGKTLKDKVGEALPKL